MSLKINPNTKQITIPRGDTGKFKSCFIPDGIPYEMNSGDTIEFRVKRSHESAEALFTKSLTTNPFVVTILPADTINLQLTNYEYSLRLIDANGEVHTFLDNRVFTVE
jgi:hypothetical protein